MDFVNVPVYLLIVLGAMYDIWVQRRINHSGSGVFRGGHWAMPPPFGLNTKIFWTHWTKKILFKFLGRGHSPSPDPFFSGEGTRPPHTPPHWRLRRLEPHVFGSGPPSQNPKYATAQWHGAPSPGAPGLDAFWQRRSVLHYSPVVNLCSMICWVYCERWENVLNASFTVHDDLIKYQRIIWGWGRGPHRIGMGLPQA